MPNNWKTYKLGDIANIGSSKRIFRADYVDTGIPFYRSKEIIQKSFGQEIDEILYIDEEKYIKIKEKFGTPKSGDILLSAVGNRSGIPYLVNNDGEFYFKDGNLMWFRDFQNYVDSSFLVYWFKSSVGQHYLNSTMIGSAQKALTIESVKNIEVPVPNLKEQKAIANILSAIDDKIENNLAINKTLEEMAMTLYKHWFVDFGPFQDGDFIDSELGPIPKGWEVKSISEVFEVRDGTHDSPKRKEEGYFLITSKHLKGNQIDYSSAYKISKEDFDKVNNRSLVEKGDILMTMIGTVGNFFFVNHKPDYAIKNIGLFKTSQTPKLQYYVYSFFNSKICQDYIKAQMSGSTQQYITLKTLRNFPIIFPSNLVLEEYSNFVKSNFETIDENIKAIETLTQLRDTLLPKLISGDVRLKEFQEQIESVL